MKKQLTLLTLLAVLAGGSARAKIARVPAGILTAASAGEVYLEYKQNLGAIERLGATNPKQLYFSPARRGAEAALDVVRHVWRAIHGSVIIDYSSKIAHMNFVALQALKLGHQFMTRKAFNLNEHNRLLFASYNAHHLSTTEHEELAALQAALRTTAKIITGAAAALVGPLTIQLITMSLFDEEAFGTILPKNKKHPTKYLLYAFASATTHLCNSIKLRNRMHKYINSILNKARALHEKGELQLITDDSANETDDKTTNQPTLTAH